MEISSLSSVPPVSHQTSVHPKQQAAAASRTRPNQAPGRVQQAARQQVQGAEAVAQQQADRTVIERLKARDREVRAHEAAHLSRAGGLAKGAPSFSFQRGPDGRLYAVGGSVDIDTAPVPGNPDATIQKARTIRAAALAPANPSAQDRAVAAAASRMEAQARLEVQEQTDRTQRQLGQVTSPVKQPSASGTDDAGPPFKRIDIYA